MNNKIKDFVIDIGDTLGGILLGLSLDAESNVMIIFGSCLIVLSVYFKYANNQKKEEEQIGKKFTIGEIVERLKQ